jgi:hypothetical protein
MQVEKQLKFGMSRKLLFVVYDELGLFKTKDEKVAFYRKSTYYKPVINISSIICKREIKK